MLMRWSQEEIVIIGFNAQYARACLCGRIMRITKIYTHVLFYKHLTFQIQSLKICLKMWISDSKVLNFGKFWVLSLKIQSLKRCLKGQTRYEMAYKSNRLLRWLRENKCERQSYKCIHESRVGMPLEILNTWSA